MRTPRIVAGATAAALAIGLLTSLPASASSDDGATIDASRTVTSSTGDIRLAWNPVRGATKYLVEVASDASFGSGTIVEKVETLALAWVPPTGLWGLSGERELFWRVTPQGVATSDPQVHRFTRAAAPAPQPTSPTPGETIAYPAPVEFSWEPVPGAVSYTLEYALDGSTSWTRVPSLVSTSYTPASLPRGSYSWRVSAHFVTSGMSTTTYQGPQSPVLNFDSVWSIDDATPKDLAPAAGTVVNDVVLRWAPVAGASAYRVELSLSHKFDTRELLSTVVGTVFAPVGLLPSKTYYWRVIPLDASGALAPYHEPNEDPDEAELAALPQVRKILGADAASEPGSQTADTTRPSLTVGTTSPDAPEEIDYNDFALGWTPVPRATFYEVEVAQINGGGSIWCQTASTSATIIAAYYPTGNSAALLSSAKPCLWDTNPTKGIVPGGTYEARVRAVDMSAATTASYQGKSGSSSDVVPSIWSDPTYFTITAPPASTLTDFIPNISGQQIIRTTSPDLAWEPMAGATGYKVEIYADISEDLEGSSEVAVFWTPTPSLKVNGVFSVNQAASRDAYLARITPADSAGYTKTPSASSPWSTFVGLATGKMTWKRVADTPAAGTVVPAGAHTLLKLTPTPAELLGGANRGYVVQIRDSNGTEVARILTDQPSTVALKSINGTNPVSMTALPKGAYSFRWAVLDAVGTPGPFSPPTPFDIGSSTVVDLDAEVLPGVTSARLSWQGAVSASKFEVTVTPEGGTPIAVTSSGSNHRATSVVVSGLVPGKRYGWSVVSIDKDNNRSESNPGPAFDVPVGTLTTASTSEAQDASRLELSWNRVDGASRYVVRVMNKSTKAIVESVETAATMFVPSKELKYGTPYVWDVRAVPEKPDSSTTRPVIAASLEKLLEVRTLPGAPSGLRATAVGTDLTVMWSALTGSAVGSSAAPEYRVEYRVTGAAAETPWTAFSSTSNATSLTVSGLALATTYDVRVVATNSVGAGPYSSVVKATTATYPGAPQNLRAAPAADALNVSWSAPSANGGAAVSGYTVRYRATGGNWIQTTTATTSVKLGGLTAATAYEIEIAAVNAVGAGSVAVLTTATSALPVTPPKPVLPGAPSSVKTVRADKKATVSWAAPASTGSQPITGYTVEMRTLSGKTWSAWARKASTTGARSAVLSSLKNGTAYQVRVIAQTTVGTGPSSGAVQFVPAGKPLATTIKVSSTKKKTVKVTWKAAASNGSKVTGYRVQYSTNGKKWSTLKSLSSKSRSYTWKKAKSKKSYYVRVQAKNALGWGAYSRSTKVTVK